MQNFENQQISKQDYNLVEEIAQSQNVNPKHLLFTTELDKMLIAQSHARQTRREKILSILPIDDLKNELDQTEKIAKKQIIYTAIDTYRRRMKMAQAGKIVSI